MKVLVKWADNWADEMDLAGHFVTERAEWDQIAKALGNYTNEMIYCVGTNEDIEYEDGTEALSRFTVTDITEDEYDTLHKLSLLSQGFTGPNIEEFDEDSWDY